MYNVQCLALRLQEDHSALQREREAFEEEKDLCWPQFASTRHPIIGCNQSPSGLTVLFNFDVANTVLPQWFDSFQI